MFSYRNRPTKNGFGLLEVLISSAILILVSGAVISLNNISVKNTVISSERTQAYNLAREWKEQLKQIRDTYVNDNNSTTCFSKTLSSSCTTGEIPFAEDYVIDSSSSLVLLNDANRVYSQKNLDSVTFTRKIEFIDPLTVSPPITDFNSNIDVSSQIRQANIVVSWTEYNKEWSVTVPVLLTNWAAI